ncbi:MAG TPA: bifunctional diaminohydroxyphosphoribosylaminopyrimidine deaminase/5-amino-6-(5-phosphoribosylamino)uracil reductase RibD, partial [Solirubrobacteraceae bacterium]
MSDDEDAAYMRRALRLAARAAGRTSPNPLVGAVIVRDGNVVGEGYHHAAGEPHAEVNALGRATHRARGATLYVNLEPCTHQGRTPPCVGAVREAGIARVVAAM